LHTLLGGLALHSPSSFPVRTRGAPVDLWTARHRRLTNPQPTWVERAAHKPHRRYAVARSACRRFFLNSREEPTRGTLPKPRARRRTGIECDSMPCGSERSQTHEIESTSASPEAECCSAPCGSERASTHEIESTSTRPRNRVRFGAARNREHLDAARKRLCFGAARSRVLFGARVKPSAPRRRAKASPPQAI
jgi:hypothetical protein